MSDLNASRTTQALAAPGSRSDPAHGSPLAPDAAVKAALQPSSVAD